MTKDSLLVIGAGDIGGARGAFTVKVEAHHCPGTAELTSLRSAS